MHEAEALWDSTAVMDPSLFNEGSHQVTSVTSVDGHEIYPSALGSQELETDLFFSTDSPPEELKRPNATPSAIARFQVCGSCRRKKRKCSLDRPTCSLCRENGWVCEYRHIKRKPGPAKGTVGLRAGAIADRTNAGVAMSLSAGAKRTLVNVYFQHIQPSFALFTRKVFEQELGEKTVPESLLNAMFAIASRLLPESEMSTVLGSSRSKKPWEAFARLAERRSREVEDQNLPIELDDVKTEILLTLYEYTNFPGRKAWMKAGNVVRMAVGLGLHRLDCEHPHPELSDLQMEEQRAVWWAVWKLDSCINILSGTPFGLDSLSVGTALPTLSVTDFTAGTSGKSIPRYLPADAARPWQSARALLIGDTPDGMGMYLLAVNHVRTVTLCRHRLFACQTPELIGHLTVLKNSLTCLRLTLPNWYFEPARESAFESPERHRVRLETALIFYVAHIQCFLPMPTSKTEAFLDDTTNWKECVDTALCVAAVFHHWKPDYFKMADPMISSIVWFAHSVLALHNMSTIEGPDGAPRDPKITNALDLLRIAMENFAGLWHISKLLLDSIDSLQVWSWLKLGFPDIVSLMLQMRIPLDPLKKQPGQIDLWQVASLGASANEETDAPPPWNEELIDWDV